MLKLLSKLFFDWHSNMACFYMLLLRAINQVRNFIVRQTMTLRRTLCCHYTYSRMPGASESLLFECILPSVLHAQSLRFTLTECAVHGRGTASAQELRRGCYICVGFSPTFEWPCNTPHPKTTHCREVCLKGGSHVYHSWTSCFKKYLLAYNFFFHFIFLSCFSEEYFTILHIVNISQAIESNF